VADPQALRIAMVTEYAYPILGGVSEHVHFLSRELVALGHEVTVVTGRTGSASRLAQIDLAAERDHGYRTVRIGRSVAVPSNGSIARITIPPRRAALLRILDGHDVMHAQGLAGSMLPLRAVAFSQAPVNVGTFHTYTEGGRHWAYRAFHSRLTRWLGGLDRRIAVSQACVDGLAPSFPSTFDVIPNGVDCERFRPLARHEVAPDGPARILFVGRLEPRNAMADLIRAGAILRDRGYDFVIQVAGDGPTRGVNERLAVRLGIADRLVWLGQIHDELPRRYREATVFAAPCTLASFGVILIEALASGTPVVCADNVGFRTVIRDGMPGRFVALRDPHALAEGLAEALDDAALRADWAARGRALTEDRYDWAGVALRVEALYREVLAERQAASAPARTSALTQPAVG
jgi:phosphatidylinositol alpha-mannosyltransferase